MAEIKWLEWSKEAFDKAKRGNKPILLDIHGVWCHWCHVQDESYADPTVIEIVDEKFVPVKVDTDKRPDINERYNQGGWPTTAFLTPDGMLIAGATYLPAAQLAIMLEQVSNYFQKSKDNLQFDAEKPVQNDANRMTLKRPPASSVSGESSEIKSVVEDVIDEMMLSFDTSYGGFGDAPKFPFPDALELALLRFRQTNDKSILKLATKTLDGLMGIFDSIEGGFFRYSVTRQWDQPHYEKMLETNVQLILNYIHAFRVTGEEKYKTTAERTAHFLMNVLHGPDGFYGSQDADKEEEYYGKPLDERKQMKQPFVDKNVYVNLNALAISALLQLEKYGKIALSTMENLYSKCFDAEKGMCHYYDGRQNVFCLLADNINFAGCLMDAYEKTGDENYLVKARQIMDFVIEKFFDEGFKDRINNKDDIGLLNVENKSIVENSIAAECLIRLSFYTSDSKYRKIAEEALSIFGTNYSRYRLHAAAYALAVEKFIDPIEITLSNKELAVGIPYDPRIMIKFDPKQEPNIIICLSNKCLKFNNLQEAKNMLLVMR